MVNRNGLLPLYQQVRLELENRIRSGVLAPGDQLASEHQLCQQLGVSRITIRQALDTLVQRGALRRVPGRGTFVAGAPFQRFVIGLAIFGFAEEVYQRQPEIFGELTAGITRRMEQDTFLLRLLHFPTEAEPADMLRGTLEREHIDGFLIRTYGDLSAPRAAALDALGIPYVLIKRSVPGRSVNCVVSDDVAGAECAVNHLLALGHRRIGLVLGPPQISIWAQRRIGYERALRQASLEIDDRLIVECSHPHEEDGCLGAGRLLDSPKPPGAIFVASDLMAIGVYEAIYARGLRIPDDISVVGYDGFRFGGHLRPALTTVRTPYFEFGAKAVRLLAQAMSGESNQREQVLVSAELVVRGSARAVHRGLEQPA